LVEEVGVDSWAKLYDEVGQEARWADDLAVATEKVMTEIAAMARQRAAELRAHTGRVLSVEFPSQKPLSLSGDGPYMSFLRIRGEAHSVHVYSHRDKEGRASAVHLFYSVADASSRRRRVESEHAFFVQPRGGGAYELRPRDAGSPASIDGLVLRAFRVLLGR
jgi:hypothetical protein